MSALRSAVKVVGFIVIVANLLLGAAIIWILFALIAGAAGGDRSGDSDSGGILEAVFEASWLGAELFATFLVGGPMRRRKEPRARTSPIIGLVGSSRGACVTPTEVALFFEWSNARADAELTVLVDQHVAERDGAVYRFPGARGSTSPAAGTSESEDWHAQVAARELSFTLLVAFVLLADGVIANRILHAMDAHGQIVPLAVAAGLAAVGVTRRLIAGAPPVPVAPHPTSASDLSALAVRLKVGGTVRPGEFSAAAIDALEGVVEGDVVTFPRLDRERRLVDAARNAPLGGQLRDL